MIIWTVTGGELMRSWLPATLLIFLLLGCDDAERAAEQKREQAARIEREKELRIMSDASSAASVLESRLDEWISKRDDALYAVEEGTVYAVPVETPWLIKCSDAGLSVWLGPWMAAEDSPNWTIIERELTSIGLNQAQCEELVGIVSRKMHSVTANNLTPKPE